MDSEEHTNREQQEGQVLTKHRRPRVFPTYRLHVMFDSEDQCLFQLPKLVKWCRCVGEERVQTLLGEAIDLREVKS